MILGRNRRHENLNLYYDFFSSVPPVRDERNHILENHSSPFSQAKMIITTFVGLKSVFSLI